MVVVLEKLVTGRDGLVRVWRREWDYKTVARETLARETGMSALAIWALLHNCDKMRVENGRQVWDSSTDSSRMYMEAQ